MEKIKLPDWFEKAKTTEKKYTRPVKYGSQSFTAINAQYQILKATEIFGLYGTGWGVESLDYGVIRDGVKNPILMTLDAVFYYWVDDIKRTFPISTDTRMFDSKGKFIDDLRKKLLTDLTTKALSKIGFNSDVFLGMYDDNKYVDRLPENKPLVLIPFSQNVKQQIISYISNAKTPAEIALARKRLGLYRDIPEQTQKDIDAAILKREKSFKQKTTKPKSNDK